MSDRFDLKMKRIQWERNVNLELLNYFTESKLLITSMWHLLIRTSPCIRLWPPVLVRFSQFDCGQYFMLVRFSQFLAYFKREEIILFYQILVLTGFVNLVQLSYQNVCSPEIFRIRTCKQFVIPSKWLKYSWLIYWKFWSSCSIQYSHLSGNLSFEAHLRVFCKTGNRLEFSDLLRWLIFAINNQIEFILLRSKESPPDLHVLRNNCRPIY